jgi:alkanesulfonate monooxygenase SsuD/methylene tetrahydromethanopterin reductase-like flavin-dependent oxidoreductase (luciferase family)
VAGFLGGIDAHATTAQLEHIATLLPEEWLAASATGSPAQCVGAIREQLAMGCDGVILHGATPAELEPIIEAYAG